MSEPDITEIKDGITFTTTIDAVEIVRTGNAWRISLPLSKRATLTDGTVVSVPAAPVSLDLATVMHHPEVAALYDALRTTTIKIVRGDIAP